MKIGIKYCGGCNPGYDRKKLVEKLMSEHLEVTFEIARENILYDIVVVINGCRRACSEHESLKGVDKLLINSENDYLKFKAMVSAKIMGEEEKFIELEKNIQ